jgi:hypothetical protein
VHLSLLCLLVTARQHDTKKDTNCSNRKLKVIKKTVKYEIVTVVSVLALLLHDFILSRRAGLKQHFLHPYATYEGLSKVSGLAAWSENCTWYSSLPLGAVISLFYESV